MDRQEGPILLSAYAARRCPRRTHNDFDRTIALGSESLELSASAQERIDSGKEFELDIVAEIMQIHRESVVEIGADLGRSAAICATEGAMSLGVPIIVGGWLPDDVAGGRKGRPDVLLKSAQPAPWSYYPVEIKRHKVLSKANKKLGNALLSPISSPHLTEARRDPEFNERRNRSESDTLQLAHYWRMLQACGRAPTGSTMAGVIGSDHLDSDREPRICWFDLADPAFQTFSRSEPDATTARSALERYDREFGFRSEVAHVAAQRMGDGADPAPLVTPIWINECEQCPWQLYCAAELGSDNASFAVRRLDARSWLALAEAQISSVGDLAALDPVAIDQFDEDAEPDGSRTDEVLRDYLAKVTPSRNALTSLARAVRAARMIEAGVFLERRSAEPIDVQRADIEVHLDVESDRSTRIYLWGMYVVDHPTGSSGYEAVSAWEPLDDQSEIALTRQFWLRLKEMISQAEAAGYSIRVYHYARPEPTGLRKAAKLADGVSFPALEEVNAVVERYFIDLFDTIRANFRGRVSLGLKDVARHGPGFQWRDEDPGGLQSQIWLDQVYAGDAGARQRILEYNEDDVRATDAVLSWLTNK